MGTSKNKKVWKVESMKNEDESIFVVHDFEGADRYIDYEEATKNIAQFYTIREKLREEKRLRKKYDNLQEAWERYQFLLSLVKNEEK